MKILQFSLHLCDISPSKDKTVMAQNEEEKKEKLALRLKNCLFSGRGATTEA